MRKNYLIYLSFIILTLSGTTAFAQTSTYSSGEDIAIAFYKTGDIAPNFTNWIENTAPYINTPWAKREDVMKKERGRVLERFNQYNPLESDLTIRTKVILEAQEVFEEIDENIVETTYFLNISFLDNEDVMYFPYVHANQNYAVMPFGLEKITRTEINKPEYDFYIENLIPKRPYYLNIDMRANQAVTKRPIEMDGINQWVLKTNIASSEIWDQNDALIWEYTAPWYTSPELEKLQNIYDLKKDNNSSKGDIKPFLHKAE